MEVKIEKLDNFGRGITYIGGVICFVRRALPGEIVKIEIIKRTKKYLEAKVVEYLKLSTKRIKDKCPYALECGGCDLGHLAYMYENYYKEEKVKDVLYKYAHITNKKIKNIIFTEEYFYRNKIILHVINKKIGFYKNKTNELVEINDCLLVSEKIKELFPFLKKLVVINDIKEIIIRSSNDNQSIMVKLVGKVTDYKDIISYVDVLYINDTLVTKKDALVTSIGKKNYQVSIDSFFQINKDLTTKLYDVILEEVKNNNYKRVLDLYCGTGSIGIYISEYVAEVIGVDYNNENVSDAYVNKNLNKSKNISFICAKVEEVIASFKDIDLIIVDPPRSGLDKNSIENIKRINPKKVIYVSCDLITLARDLKLLQEKYNVLYVQPVNMFPRTYHIECVCVLKLKEKI